MRAYYNDIFNYGKTICPDEAIVKESIREVFIALWKRNTNVDIWGVKLYLLRELKIRILPAMSSMDTEIPLSAHRYDPGPDYAVEQKLVSGELSLDDRCSPRAIISSLSKSEKEAVYLKFSQMLDNTQIAALMNTNPHVVHRLLQGTILRFGTSGKQ